MRTETVVVVESGSKRHKRMDRQHRMSRPHVVRLSRRIRDKLRFECRARENAWRELDKLSSEIIEAL